MKETNKSLESLIWDAAWSIRGAKDAPKYKEFILPLIFTKRLCDVFDDSKRLQSPPNLAEQNSRCMGGSAFYERATTSCRDSRGSRREAFDTSTQARRIDCP